MRRAPRPIGRPRPWPVRRPHLRTGRSIREIAAREGLTDRYVARLLDLAFLPPAIVEDILDGRQPVEWTSEMLS